MSHGATPGPGMTGVRRQLGPEVSKGGTARALPAAPVPWWVPRVQNENVLLHVLLCGVHTGTHMLTHMGGCTRIGLQEHAQRCVEIQAQR